jgi:uncharacterized protein (DUF488 family)
LVLFLQKKNTLPYLLLMTPLYTIGYESLVQDELLNRLKGACVGLLLDIRAIASSRKPGFSKTLLAGSAAARGVEYLHLRALGTPKPGRQAARAGNAAEMERIFRAHMNTPEAQHALAQAEALARHRPVCLLCFEKDPHLCHRRLVAEMISARTGQTVIHL